jgi:hypothetical protein
VGAYFAAANPEKESSSLAVWAVDVEFIRRSLGDI